MFTATGALRDSAPWGDIQEITYGLRDPADHDAPGKDLYRTVTRNVLAVATPDRDDQWLLGGVKASRFRVSTAPNGPAPGHHGVTSVNTNLPVAVRVRIQLAGNNTATTQPIEILVPIDSLSRTNMIF